MIRCLVTATAASQQTLDAAGLSADQFLIDAIERGGAQDDPAVELVSVAEQADVVIFAETHQDDAERDDAVQRVLEHPVYRRHRRKCVVHSGKDIPRPLLPGLYPSIDRAWAALLGCQGAPYLASLNPWSPLEEEPEVDRLASFMGACARKRVRMRLFEIAQAAGWRDVVVRDSGAEFIASLRSGDDERHLALKREFTLELRRSRFALCPRGAGASSFRIFEAMRAGRAPVVIADDWTPPPGPRWGEFLIRVPERDLERLPQLLGVYTDAWRARGDAARRAWEAHYAPDRLGETVVRQALEVVRQADGPAWRRQLAARAYVNGPRRLAILRKRVRRKRAAIEARLQAAFRSSRGSPESS